MPAFFHKATAKGIVVSNKKMESKEVTIKGKKGMVRTNTADLKFGFFAWENPEELGLQKGDMVPVSLSTNPVLPDSDKLFWCNPD